jgi:hypothetical protein
MEDRQDMYRELVAGKDSPFWKALESYLDGVIKRTRDEDDGDRLDTWMKIGKNKGARLLAKGIKELVNKEAITHLSTAGGDKDDKPKRRRYT